MSVRPTLREPPRARLLECSLLTLGRIGFGGSCLGPVGTTHFVSVAREQPPVEKIVQPFQDFAHKQSSGGILLIIATTVALVWASSPWGDSYAALWHTKLTVGIGDLSISKESSAALPSKALSAT